MKVIVKPHSIQVVSTPVNELELNITKVEFEFSEEITDDFVKEAYFTLDDNTYKKIIVNNECEIPYEVLTKVGTIELGVVAYLVENDEEIKRYNPQPGYFTSWEGSLKDAENSQPITPSEMEQYEQALQEGLTEIDNALDDLQEKVDSGYFKGDKGDKGDTGPQGIQGVKGDKGDTGLTGPQGIQGVKGEKGDKGDTGSKGDKGDKGDTGSTGPMGPAGQNGSNGQDGFSPIASISKSGNVATISITDKNGTTTATISDGQTPDMSNYYTKAETDQAIASAITTTLGGNY